MGKWHKTGCVLCAQNCGLEILVENDRMVKVKPDKSNPRSQGYACRNFDDSTQTIQKKCRPNWI